MMAAVPGVAAAQTGQTAQIPLQFDFLNPGARSLALGSAFVAVADDATAAFTNPAGLTSTIRTAEVSAEFRYRTLDTPYLSSGRLSGTPTGQGLDVVNGPVYGVSGDAAARPYFLSAVYKHEPWFAAVYRHELVLQTNTFISQGPFYKAGVFNNARLFGLQGNRDISIVTYGASAAYRVSPHLSIGEGLAVYRFSLDSHFASLDYQGDFFSPADPRTAGQGSTTTQAGSGTQVAFNVGALVTFNRSIRVGAVFRQSASFLFSEVNNVPDTPTLTRVGAFHTPGVLGVGARFTPIDAWAIAVDYDRVQYSHLTTDFIAFQVDPSVANRTSIPNGNELHVGTEYTFVEWTNKLAIRAGAWFDPDHAVHYTPDGADADTDTRFEAVFPGGKSVWHYSAGFGLPLSRLFEVNVGSDFTSQRKYVSASLVARFGK